ncbi:MAG: hypothetical protein HFE61_09150 [Anaerotignum sp.]|jgi:hypothetical protein|nr:hypothetical protein [Anaerotignum sp.]
MKKQLMKLFSIAMVTFTLSFVTGMSLYVANHDAPAMEQLQAQDTPLDNTTASAVLPE